MYVSGNESPTITNLQYSENDIEFVLTENDGVCGSTTLDIQPNDFDPSDDGTPEDLEAVLDLCPDVAAPAPVLTIQMGGAGNSNVAGTTRNVVIGQYIDLTASVLGASSPVSYQWTVPSNTAINWNPFQADSTIGQPVPIPANQLSSSGISFAWTSTGSSSVALVATPAGGTPLTGSVTFNVVAPSPQPTAVETGVVIVPLNPSSPASPMCPGLTGAAMCLYSPRSGAPGIAFGYSVGASPGDQYEWVQVVNSATIDKTDSSGNVCEVNLAGLDGGGVYYSPDGVNASDSPGSALVNPPYVELARSDSFSTFLMYMPQGGIWGFRSTRLTGGGPGTQCSTGPNGR